jgi:cell division protein FtsB
LINHQPANQHYVFKVPGTGKVWWRVSIGLGFLLVVLLFFVGEKSVFKVSKLYQEQADLKNQVAELKAKNQKMQQQIEDLKYDPLAIERIAREELGLVRQDEKVYRFLPPEPKIRK